MQIEGEILKAENENLIKQIQWPDLPHTHTHTQTAENFFNYCQRTDKKVFKPPQLMN